MPNSGKSNALRPKTEAKGEKWENAMRCETKEDIGGVDRQTIQIRLKQVEAETPFFKTKFRRITQSCLKLESERRSSIARSFADSFEALTEHFADCTTRTQHLAALCGDEHATRTNIELETQTHWLYCIKQPSDLQAVELTRRQELQAQHAHERSIFQAMERTRRGMAAVIYTERSNRYELAHACTGEVEGLYDLCRRLATSIQSRHAKCVAMVEAHEAQRDALECNEKQNRANLHSSYLHDTATLTRFKALREEVQGNEVRARDTLVSQAKDAFSAIESALLRSKLQILERLRSFHEQIGLLQHQADARRADVVNEERTCRASLLLEKQAREKGIRGYIEKSLALMTDSITQAMREKRELFKVCADGVSNMHTALHEALETTRERIAKHAVSRALLLNDEAAARHSILLDADRLRADLTQAYANERESVAERSKIFAAEREALFRAWRTDAETLCDAQLCDVERMCAGFTARLHVIACCEEAWQALVHHEDSSRSAMMALENRNRCGIVRDAALMNVMGYEAYNRSALIIQSDQTLTELLSNFVGWRATIELKQLGAHENLCRAQIVADYESGASTLAENLPKAEAVPVPSVDEAIQDMQSTNALEVVARELCIERNACTALSVNQSHALADVLECIAGAEMRAYTDADAASRALDSLAVRQRKKQKSLKSLAEDISECQGVAKRYEVQRVELIGQAQTRRKLAEENRTSAREKLKAGQDSLQSAKEANERAKDAVRTSLQGTQSSPSSKRWKKR